MQFSVWIRLFGSFFLRKNFHQRQDILLVLLILLFLIWSQITSLCHVMKLLALKILQLDFKISYVADLPMTAGNWTAAQRCRHNWVFPLPAWPATSVTVPGVKPPFVDVPSQPNALSIPSLNVNKLLLNLQLWSNESCLNWIWKLTLINIF